MGQKLQTMANGHKKYLNISEAAQFLDVSTASLRRWTNSGKLRGFRVGGRRERRFLEEDLVAFMQATNMESTAKPIATPTAAHEHANHVALFFRDPDEQWQMLRPYLLSHLQEGAPVLYIQDGTPPKRLKAWLRAEGLNVEQLIADQLLRILSPDQAYLLTGRFDTERMLAFMESAILAAVAAGHTRVFLSGEMTWSLANSPGAAQMMAYEALLNPMLEKYPTTTIVCQYDLKRFNSSSVLDALLTHPTAHLASGVVAGYYRM